jgi:hypothetical protein
MVACTDSDFLAAYLFLLITLLFTTPQPQNSDVPSVGIGRYSDVPSVGIDLCRHLLKVAESGVGIAYADRHVFSDRLSDAIGVIYTDT